MSQSSRKRESPMERYAWTAFLALGVILVLFGVGDVLTGGSTYGQGESAAMQAISGMTWSQLEAISPGGAALIDHGVREGGFDEILLGLFGAALALTAVRRGERWAWYLMWLWPLWIVGHVLILWSEIRYKTGSPPAPFVSGSVFLIFSLAALALSYRRSITRQV